MNGKTGISPKLIRVLGVCACCNELDLLILHTCYNTVSNVLLLIQAIVSSLNAKRNIKILEEQKFCSVCVLLPNFSLVNGWMDELGLHGPSMLTVKAKIYGMLYNQSSSIAFDETSSFWSGPKSS